MGPELVVPLFFFLIPFLIPVLYVIGIYNRLVKLRFTVRESWSNVDTELKRRYDLIPNLVETVKGYAKHEREVLEAVVRARAQAVASTGSPASQARDENELVRQMRSLWAVVERYPDLKANQNFLRLQQELVNTEDRIQAARRFYNSNVRAMNVLVQSFPSNLIAGLFGFKGEEYFEIEDSGVRGPVAVSLT
ncbi:MAG: LemA family protein [Candidatus Sumerlaeia bacterium]|nr:LemA family protein [Candidatus Sumerlaeia bacterium]